mgnify:CR=1 FL=1
MLRGASFPALVAASAAPFAAATAVSLRGGFSLGKKKTPKSQLSSLPPLRRSLASSCSSSSSTSSTKLAALSSRDTPPPPRLDFQPDSLTGRWHKSKDESDDMRAACDAVELNKILRVGVALVNTLDVSDERRGPDAHFATTLKAGGILDVKERYPWSGAAVEHSRRDKRRGKHLGRVTLIAAEESENEEEKGSEKRLHPQISVTWDDPHGGECTDTFVLSRDGHRMTQLSVLAVRGKEIVKYTTVFTR